MHITSIEIKGEIPPLNDLEFTFDPDVNVFVGSNGTGKTTLLRCISDQMYKLIEEWASNSGEVVRWLSSDWPNLGGVASGADIQAVPQIFIPATRTIMPVDNSDAAYLSRGQARTEIASFLNDDMYLFDSLNSYHAVKFLYETGRSVQAAQVAWHAFSCASSISQEIIEAEAGLSTYRGLPTRGTIAEDWARLDDRQRRNMILLANPDIVHPAMGFQTVDGNNLFVGELSAGTQGVFSWILYAALRLASFNRFTDGWEEKPAILLIDEIENHLHPTWQRRVISSLTTYFPGIQIFATTHSPFAISGLGPGQVQLLTKGEDNKVSFTTNTENIVGWTADEILRTMMDVDDPTDDATAAAASELRKLRNEGPRDTVEAEEQRQQRMAELRRSVDRDLLAGGPEAAQRELFEQQFEEALEKFRQSQSLNQENG